MSLAKEVLKSRYSSLLSQFKDIIAKNEELVISSVLSNPYNFNRLPDTMRNSVEFAGKIAKRNGYTYLKLGKKIKSKKEHVLFALRNLDNDKLIRNKRACFFTIEDGIPENLRNDTDVIQTLSSLNKGLLALASSSSIKKALPNKNVNTLLNESFLEFMSISSLQGVNDRNRLFLKLPDFIIKDKKKFLKVIKDFPYYYIQLNDKLKKDTDILKQLLNSWTKIDYSNLRLNVFNSISNYYGKQSLRNFSLTPFDGVDSSLIKSVDDCIKVLKVTPLSYINIPDRLKEDPRISKYKKLYEAARKKSIVRNEVYR